jgi:hypothetical protein
MTDQELLAQYKQCQLWSDADQWDVLAVEFYRRGYTLNAMQCFQNADDIRGCAFAEAMRVDLLEQAR